MQRFCVCNNTKVVRQHWRKYIPFLNENFFGGFFHKNFSFEFLSSEKFFKIIFFLRHFCAFLLLISIKPLQVTRLSVWFELEFSNFCCCYFLQFFFGGRLGVSQWCERDCRGGTLVAAVVIVAFVVFVGIVFIVVAGGRGGFTLYNFLLIHCMFST